MPHSGNSWQQFVEGLFEVVQCRRALFPISPFLANFRVAEHPGVITQSTRQEESGQCFAKSAKHRPPRRCLLD